MLEETVVGRVTRSLRERVLVGDITPDTALAQSDIAAEHGASESQVRDALHVLASEGLVDLGATVAVVRALSIEELRELYELREAVEPRLTRIAVPRIGEADIARMTELAQEMESDPPPAVWLAANAQFHALVYTRADRPRMVELIEQARRLTDRYLYLHVGVFGDRTALHAAHRGILDAARRGDADDTAELTRLHIVRAHAAIHDYLVTNQLVPSNAAG